MPDPIRADTILFDFDGPICRLFAVHPASRIERHLLTLLKGSGGRPDLAERWERTDDPLAVLRAVDPGSRLAGLLEQALTEQEKLAAKSAAPTDGAEELIRELVDSGRRVAITTNNGPPAVENYLAAQGLLPFFAGHVHGRVADSRLLKPHPDCLERALKSTGTPREKALMIGDAVDDLRAARAAGVSFLGFSQHAARRAELHEAGAEKPVGDLREVIATLRLHPTE
jgi:HAD superfamily hydrolase (TIGR01549 family)